MMERFQDKVQQEELDGDAADQIVSTFENVSTQIKSDTLLQ